MGTFRLGDVLTREPRRFRTTASGPLRRENSDQKKIGEQMTSSARAMRALNSVKCRQSFFSGTEFGVVAAKQTRPRTGPAPRRSRDGPPLTRQHTRTHTRLIASTPALRRSCDSRSVSCRPQNAAVRCEPLACPRLHCPPHSAAAYVPGACCKECQREWTHTATTATAPPPSSHRVTAGWSNQETGRTV